MYFSWMKTVGIGALLDMGLLLHIDEEKVIKFSKQLLQDDIFSEKKKKIVVNPKDI